MRDPFRDRERLHHIDKAICPLIEGASSDIDRIQEGSLEYFGMIKLIEIIVEAVYKLTNEFKDTHSATPWRKIERMRHVFVHGYETIYF